MGSLARTVITTGTILPVPEDPLHYMEIVTVWKRHKPVDLCHSSNTGRSSVFRQVLPIVLGA